MSLDHLADPVKYIPTRAKLLYAEHLIHEW
jgi:hypothetical protein